VTDGDSEVEVTRTAYDEYNAVVDERNARKAYSDPRSNSYYWSEHNRSITNCPFTAAEMWRFLRHPDPDHLERRHRTS
jgi:hypothetical protein